MESLQMKSFKNLNLDRESIPLYIERFMEENQLKMDGEIQKTQSRLRVLFGSTGADFATVDIHLNINGTTTVSWGLGKNQDLGEHLSNYLKATVDEDSLTSINFSLSGILRKDFDGILECISESADINTTTLEDTDSTTKIRLTSIQHQDTLTVSYYSTRKLQIQGRPLACYRRLIYLLTELLDLKGLELVLYKKEESSAEIVRKEIATDYLKLQLPCLERLPDSIKKLLLSSCCVKLASPKLADYCLLLYPELRALEGILKQNMSYNGMYVEDAEHGFGTFLDFDKTSGKAHLKDQFHGQIEENLRLAIENAYTFYKLHRHTLFHMEEYPDGSRMIDTLDKAIALSKSSYELIEAIYVTIE